MTGKSEDPECLPYLRKRTEIEEEIRKRQARWRVNHRAEQIKTKKEKKQDKERRPSGGAVGVDTEPDREAPPATHYRSRR